MPEYFRRLKVRSSVAIYLTAVLGSMPATIRAQANVHTSRTADRLGTVHFQNSCSATVAAELDRAVTLLHSFEFGASTRSFDAVLASDSTCAMAWWGLAMNAWTNPMVQSARPAAQLARGRTAVANATIHGTQSSDRERGYISAVSELYRDVELRDQRTRVVAYERAMTALAERFSEDTEAKIFAAIALVADALPSDKTYANQLRAGAVLEALFAQQPNHPGLAHYIIHSYDVPALADRASVAARRYSTIAPEAAHALHMPSHTFTRVGKWKESVETNLRSFDAALRDASIAEALHAADYAVYANLQLRRYAAALAIVRRLPELAARFDPAAVTGAAPGSAGIFALAAIPARYAMERRMWSESAALQPSPTASPYAAALTYFARALGAAHLHDSVSARSAIDTLVALHTQLVARHENYQAEQVNVERLSATAWLDLSHGHTQIALDTMRVAADHEAATEKDAVSPGPLVPARELLGDMLLSVGRPMEALVEYQLTLVHEPNRYRSLYGARAASIAARDASAARRYARALAQLH